MDYRFVRREKREIPEWFDELCDEAEEIVGDIPLPEPGQYVSSEKYQNRFERLCSYTAALVRENDGLELEIRERPWLFCSMVSGKFEYASMFSPQSICSFYKGIALADSFEICACGDECFVINFVVYGTFEKRKDNKEN